MKRTWSSPWPARFDDRVTGAVSMFCPDSTIVHIDIDACEINKNKKVAHPIRANVKDALGVLNAALAGKGWERQILRLHPYAGMVQDDRRLEGTVPLLL